MNGSTAVEATAALFVPGDRPDRFDKAIATAAQLVILDLEDAVAPSAKPAASTNAVAAIVANAGQGRLGVRINGLGEGAESDARELGEAIARVSGPTPVVMVPKAESVDGIGHIADLLGHETPLIALIETAQGLENARSIARHPSVQRLAFGALDFCADVGATADAMLDLARCELVLASRLAGTTAPLDSPSPDFRDLLGLEKLARRAHELGFGGQLCIHPAQVSVVLEAFEPTPAERAWAHAVLQAVHEGVGQLDGRMIDRPVLLRARRIATAT